MVFLPPEDQQALDSGRTKRTTSTSTHTHSGSGGGTSSTSTTADQVDQDFTDYTDETQTRFNGIPGMPEVWKNSETGEVYLVYYPTSGPQPPVPILFIIETDEELKSLFGDKTPVFDKLMDSQSFLNLGAIFFGEMASLDRYDNNNQLILDPWAGFTSRMERAMKRMPWLAEDPEVFAIVAAAYLEGRPVEDWELEATPYFIGHSVAEREAMRMQLSDPKGYEDRHQRYSTDVYDLLASYGLDPEDDVIAFAADMFNAGLWDWDDVQAQIQAYVGRGGSQELNDAFIEFLDGRETPQATSNLQDIRDMYTLWLGPAFPPDDAALQRWAAKFDDDQAGGRSALEAMLRGQRIALFPNYGDADVTYADIAAPWRSFTQRIWGVPVDDLDEDFQAILQLNDPQLARQMARQVGSDRGYATVVDSMISDLESGMRTGVRGAV